MCYNSMFPDVMHTEVKLFLKFGFGIIFSNYFPTILSFGMIHFIEVTGDQIVWTTSEIIWRHFVMLQS